jgi:hypothetical protein
MPAATFERARGLTGQRLKTLCPSLEELDQYVRRIGFPPEPIPYSSDARRRLGEAHAVENNAKDKQAAWLSSARSRGRRPR